MREKIPVSVGIDIGNQSLRAAFISERMRTPTMVSINGESVVKTRVGFTRGKVEWGPAPITPLKAKDYFEGFKTIFFNNENVQNPIWTFQRTEGTPMRFVLGGTDFRPTSVFVTLLHKVRLAIIESICKELHVQESDVELDTTVSLPVCYDITHRHAIKTYLEMTGFPSVSLCEDTAAAAMAYITSNNMSHGNLLVFSTGSGFTSAGCFTVIRPCMIAIESRRSFASGGMDVTAALFEKAKQLLEEKHKGEIDWGKPINIFKLRAKCEESKQQLKEDNVEIRLELNCEEFSVELTPQHLIDACEGLKAKAEELVQGVLNESEFDITDITDAIMVGGGSRVGPIETSLQQRFRSLNMTKGVVAEEAVARGAAILGWHARLKSKNSPLAWVMHNPNSQEEISRLIEISSERATDLSLNDIISRNFQALFNQNETPFQINNFEIAHTNQSGLRFLLIQRVLDGGIRVTIPNLNGDCILLKLQYSFKNTPRLEYSEEEIRELLNRDQSEFKRGALVNDLVKLAADISDWEAKSVLCKEVYSQIEGKMNETRRNRAVMSFEELQQLQYSVLSEVCDGVKAILSPLAEFLDFTDIRLKLRNNLENVFATPVKNIDPVAYELQLLDQWKIIMDNAFADLIHEMDSEELRSESAKWNKFVGTLQAICGQDWKKTIIDDIIENFYSSLEQATEELLTKMEQKFPKFQKTATINKRLLSTQGYHRISFAKAVAMAFKEQMQKAKKLEADVKHAWETIEEFLQNQSSEMCNFHIEGYIDKLQRLRPQVRNIEGHSTL